jgi:hypothetical protein
VLVCNSPQEIPGVLDSLDGYVNPAAQLRLARLHGGASTGWEALRRSAEWRRACSALEPLCARPGLELQG